jgi:GntR family transcriptional regulator, transcriptional repressor for pyruvate dehydrogenase complex
MSMTVCQRIYDQPNPELRQRGYHYQRQLIEALRRRDTEAARRIVSDHMQAAQALMEEREALLEKTFFKADGESATGPSREYLALSDFTEAEERRHGGKSP